MQQRCAGIQGLQAEAVFLALDCDFGVHRLPLTRWILTRIFNVPFAIRALTFYLTTVRKNICILIVVNF